MVTRKRNNIQTFEKLKFLELEFIHTDKFCVLFFAIWNFRTSTIYYFSGTGNVRNVAIWIEKVAKEKGLRTHLINIDRFKTVDIPELSEKTLIGFCSATHGFNIPPIVLKLLPE